MIRPNYQSIEYVDIPTFQPEAIATGLERLILGELPAFVIHHAGIRAPHNLPPITNIAAGHGFYNDWTSEAIGKHPYRMTGGDSGFHVDDYFRQHNAPPVKEFNDHFTYEGEARCELLVPKPEMQHAEATDRDRVLVDLNQPENTTVDASLFETTGYQGTLKPGDRLLFRSAGLQPLFHRFTSLTPERSSIVAVYTKKYDRITPARP